MGLTDISVRFQCNDILTRRLTVLTYGLACEESIVVFS